MNRKRNLWVVVATLALVMAVIPGASADPVSDGVGSVDPSTGIWHLSTGLSANLTGAAEVPGPGDANATGSAHLNLDADSGEVCFAITHKNVDGTVVAAHIHEGGTDVSGGVVIDLEWSTTGGTGCVTADPGAVAAVSAEPSGYYVNVHSTIFPAGAIRGQLAEGGESSFYFGNPDDNAFQGDWDGDGVDTPGLHRPSDGFVYLRNSNTQGFADIMFFFGNPGDVPLIGDWDGDGDDTVSLYRPSNDTVYIIDELGSDGGGLGAADYFFTWGNPGDAPVVGDWDGDGADELGAYSSNGTFRLKNALEAGPPDAVFVFGNPGDDPVAGDWDGDGFDTVGVFRSADSTFYLRNSNTSGVADEARAFGAADWQPVTGATVPGSPVALQFLTISDWHAQLDPLFVFGAGSFGGAAELSTYFQAERAANPNTITLTAGDAFGASPPLSNFFDEVPAVESMNLMGFDLDGLGNHNFDRGIAHLQSMIDIADFPYVSSNLENVDDNLTGVEPWIMLNRGGIDVAIIGVTNPEAPTLVFPGNFGTIVVTDPVAAAMAARAEAEAAGADVFVAIGHLGVTSFDGAGDPSGPLIDFAEGVTGFDFIFGDHTDVEFSGTINGALVVENRSRGRTYARVSALVNPVTGNVLSKSSEFVEPFSDAVVPDPAIVAYLDPLRAELDVKLSGVIGESTVFIPRSDECGQDAGRSCESLVGDVTTDAMRDRYGVDFAITNSGGLRADLTCPTSDLEDDFCPPNTPPNFQITDGQVLTVLPFGNTVVTLEVDGAELKSMLENGVSAMPDISGRFAQVSGLCFTYDIDLPPGSRVTGAVRQAGDGSCTGAVVDLTDASTYTIAENDFMANGGDDYPDFSARAVSREFMDQVVADYVAANTPITPVINGRITCIGATCPVPVP